MGDWGEVAVSGLESLGGGTPNCSRYSLLSSKERSQQQSASSAAIGRPRQMDIRLRTVDEQLISYTRRGRRSYQSGPNTLHQIQRVT